jgi:excisionase family DNA binding protein
MLSIVMFFLGIVLLNRGRAHVPFLRIHAEGSAVRTAGMVLMMPFGFSILLGIFAGMQAGGNIQALYSAIESVAFLELIAILIAATAAYVILKRNEVPFTSEQSEPQKPAQPRRTHPLENAPYSYTPSPAVRPAPQAQQTIPRIMSVAEAARYLNVTEQRIMDAINNGEIAAARGNGGYSIARIVLDEYREGLQLSQSPS